MGSPEDSQNTSGGNPVAIAAGVTVGLLVVVAAVIAVGIAVFLVIRGRKRRGKMSVLNVQKSNGTVRFTNSIRGGKLGQHCLFGRCLMH